ncbi:phosphoribosyltransferase [Oscillospiraceae bacterium OttesenSCG-928-F05]|nr:phosphoribosyltransferase [Oscillospiraceae bacterium OttesenSCG-928-F05]
MVFRKSMLKSDKNVYADIASGHFATNHSHINTYVDLTHIKTSVQAAKRAAALLAEPLRETAVETVICLEGTDMLGAFLAEALSAESGFSDINHGIDIHVLKPELNSNNQMVFRENTRGSVAGRHIVLFLASISTGKTITRAVDCLDYYGGKLAGICAGFSAVAEHRGMPVYSVFSETQFPEYRTYIPHECAMCREGRKIDAIINQNGFSDLP